MRREAEKYRSYARECLRQAEQAETEERRDKLFNLARVWVDAAATLDNLDRANGGAGVQSRA
jgi:hypothetical protein